MTLTNPRSRPSEPELDARIVRLNSASSRRPVEPDAHLPWGTLGPGQVIPDELLSIDGLALETTPAGRARLSREEVASMLAMGVRFEAVLSAGFARIVGEAPELDDPRVTYMLHEIGEEAKHSRAFVRLIAELAPTTRNPLDRPVLTWVTHRVTRRIADHDALLLTMTLAGEEIPDLLQKLAAEHPDTDPMLAALNRYHRQEEARHLSFARAVLSDTWSQAGPIERAMVRFVAPGLIALLWQAFVHPGVYAAAGLPTWSTWKSVQRLPRRVQLRRRATRPVLAALIDAGAIRRGRVPRGWQHLCGVDRQGAPVD
ncbi:MAG: diiron oxygenase [Acidimicrobiia bacterium]